MARIKIEDLPVLEDLSSEEAKGILGGEFTPMNIYQRKYSSIPRWVSIANVDVPQMAPMSGGYSPTPCGALPPYDTLWPIWSLKKDTD